MSRSERAIIKSELLVWARESAGMDRDDAAHRLSVQPGRLQAWEAGSGSPTVNQLRTAAHIYRVPLAAFFLPAAPPVFHPPVEDFRKLPGTLSQGLSSTLQLHVRWALQRRQICLDLHEALHEPPPVFDLITQPDRDAETVAGVVRGRLGIGMEAQRRWHQPDVALRNWVAAVEGIGVLILQTRGVAVDEMRGYSIADTPLPIIVLNGQDTPAGRTFTLFHELAHLLLRKSGVCELDVTGPRQAGTEVFCNRLAGAILVPCSELLADPAVKQHRGMAWTDAELGALARQFGVSREVMLRRLLLAGKTTAEVYGAARSRLLAQYEKRKPIKEGKPLSPAIGVVKSVGKRFARLVLGAYHSEHITGNDLADYLGIRLKHLAKVEALVGM
ncbi:MAG: ImmA/IrrE family metallo-endopeptidase [Candidatus Riflebacteria bacterium]|nr:ImmA/IrrE family metallo-endopeptidase [Candidatus Riflebacteria bacterium]